MARCVEVFLVSDHVAWSSYLLNRPDLLSFAEVYGLKLEDGYEGRHFLPGSLRLYVSVRHAGSVAARCYRPRLMAYPSADLSRARFCPLDKKKF